MRKKEQIIVAIILCVLVYIYASNKQLEMIRYISKPLATLLVISIPIFLKSHQSKYKTYIITGLFFCLIGDVALLFKDFFILGLVAFLIAHLIFIRAFIVFYGFIKNYKILIGLICYAILFILFIRKDLDALFFPVLAYISCILVMAWQGISLYAFRSKKMFKFIALAVILFFISDSILAIDKFKMAIPYANTLIGVTYWCAITLLALSTTFAAKNLTQT